MAEAFTVSNLANALREMYDEKRIHDLTKPLSPLAAMVPRKTKWDGGVSGKMHVVVNYAKHQTTSPSFSEAQTAAGVNSYGLAEFQVDAKELFAASRINGQMLARARLAGSLADANVLISEIEMKVDSAMKDFGESLSVAIFGDGSGAIGQVATSGLSTTSLTLSNIEDAQNFEPGMRLQHSSDKTGGAVESSGAIATVTKVNPVTGVLTAGANWTTTWSEPVADAHYLYKVGSYDASINGIAGWLVASASAPGSFLNVDRDLHRNRLAGVTVDGTGKSIAQAILEGVLLSGKAGGENHHVVVNTREYQTLLDQEAGKQTYESVAIAGTHFDSVLVRGGKTVTRVMHDPFCPVGFGWGLDINPSKVALVSTGSFPQILDFDGLTMSRISDADGYEVRIGGYGNLIVPEPAAHFSMYNLGA